MISWILLIISWICIIKTLGAKPNLDIVWGLATMVTTIAWAFALIYKI